MEGDGSERERWSTIERNWKLERRQKGKRERRSGEGGWEDGNAGDTSAEMQMSVYGNVDGLVR